MGAVAVESGSRRNGGPLDRRGWIVAGALAMFILGIIIDEMRDMQIYAAEQATKTQAQQAEIDALRARIDRLTTRFEKARSDWYPEPRR